MTTSAQQTDPRVSAALEQALERGEIGVQIAAYLGQELLVDACIGVSDEQTREPVTPTTLFPVFSVTKAMTATAVHLQAERGLLDLDAPVAAYWPEYASQGKDAITIRHVLTHRAGVPQIPPELTPEGLADWDAIVDWLAEVEPICPPGERSMYHSMSFGYILGEVIRRTDPQHRLPGAFVREELCAPIGVEDLWIGLPADQRHRVATLTWGAEPPAAPQVAPSPLREASMPAAVAPVPEVYNRADVQAACIPAAGGITTARDGARFFALLANGGALDGVRLLDEQRLRALTEPRENPLERDESIGMVTWIGVGGFWLGGPHPPASPVVGSSASILAQGGAGGSIAWADLGARLAVMITHNRMFGDVPADRHPFVPLGRALREIAAEA